MDRLWWQLPGPGGFISGIERALRDGKNVVLLLPQYIPSGIEGMLRMALREVDGWSWRTLDVGEDGSERPIDVLFSSFLPDGGRYSDRKLSILLDNPSFTGKIIWVEGLSERHWPAWKHFVEEYSHACMSKSILDRGLLCIPLKGRLAVEPPTVESVCLSLHKFYGVVSGLDMQVYTWRLLQSREATSFQRRIAVSVISSLALWDPTVAQVFAQRPLEDILNPRLVLQAICRERQWQRDVYISGEYAWCQGILDSCDGREVLHSAYCVSDDTEREIERRIWSAEVGVAFPFIEEMRRLLLEKFGTSLRVPYPTKQGIVDDHLDLEIVHIENQVYAFRIPTTPQVRRLLWVLKEMRNALSHLEPLRPEFILEENLEGLVEQGL